MSLPNFVEPVHGKLIKEVPVEDRSPKIDSFRLQVSGSIYPHDTMRRALFKGLEISNEIYPLIIITCW